MGEGVLMPIRISLKNPPKGGLAELEHLAVRASLTEQQAKLLATMGPKYRARRLRGQWCVWDEISDHVVEFNDVEGCIAALERRNQWHKSRRARALMAKIVEEGF
jgi:hypothetical protein